MDDADFCTVLELLLFRLLFWWIVSFIMGVIPVIESQGAFYEAFE